MSSVNLQVLWSNYF